MNSNDIKNLSKLTEALRGRGTHKGVYETILLKQQKQNLPPKYIIYYVYAIYNSWDNCYDNDGLNEIEAAEEVKVNIAGISFEDQVQVALVAAAYQMQKSSKRDLIGFVSIVLQFNKWRGFENTYNGTSFFQVDWTNNKDSMYLYEGGVGYVVSRNKDQIEQWFAFAEEHWG
jgi:hypothetical protein